MNTAHLTLHDLDTRVGRIEAIFCDPVASDALLREAYVDTPIVGEILANSALGRDVGPEGSEAKARDDARRKLATILVLRELEREAMAVVLSPAPQTSPLADLFRAIACGFRALLDCLGWLGATSDDVVRSAFRRLAGARR